MRSPRMPGRTHSQGAPEDDSSASEIEYEADRLRRQRSRLFVTNAHVAPSSSSDSESAAKRVISDPRPKLPTLAVTSMGRSNKAIGLGIGIRSDIPTPLTGNHSEKEQSHAGQHTPDQTSLDVRDYHSSDATRSMLSEDAPTGSLFDGGESSTNYHEILQPACFQVAANTNEQGITTADGEVDHQKKQRRATLRGLIDVLDSSQLSNIPTQPTTDNESDPNPYNGFLVGEDIASDASTRPIVPRHEHANSDDDSNYSSDGDSQSPSGINLAPGRAPAEAAKPMHGIPFNSNDDIGPSDELSSGTQLAPRRPRPLTLISTTTCADSVLPSTPTMFHSNNHRPMEGQGAKSPGRSPIVRHSMAVTVPAALRRYSVYRDDPLLPVRVDEEKPSLALPAPGFSEDEKDEQNQHAKNDEATLRLSHADSDLSSMYSSDSARWQEEDDGFSSGAASLFRQLSDSRPAKDSDMRSQAVTARSSVTSFYQGEVQPTVREAAFTTVDDLWKHELQSTVNPLKQAPPDPSSFAGEDLERRALLESLYESEVTFLDRMHTIVRVFIKPLRVRDTKTWVGGVPADVGRLFDWLEDISVLHTHIRLALESLRNRQGSGAERIGQTLRDFVPRLEVYQPYLVRNKSAIANVMRLADDPMSDLGEFIRMQEKDSACHGWSLERLLHGPVEHLDFYPKMFSVGLNMSCMSVCVSDIFFSAFTFSYAQESFRSYC